MTSFGDALTYPAESEEWMKTVLIGGALTFLGFLIVPLIPVYGYVVRVIRERLNGNPEPPSFTEWRSLFMDGLQAWIIGLVYMIVPLIVGGLTLGGSLTAMATASRTGTAADIAGMLGGLALTFVLMLVFGYVAVAAVVNFAREERFGAAFDFGTIRDVILDRDYAIAWFTSVVVFIGASIVSGVLNVIPLLGVLVGSFVFFYADIVAASLWAGGYTTALGHEDDVGRARAEEPAI